MLASVLVAQHLHIASLAKSWLANGASSFGVWSDGIPLAQWPERSQPQQPSVIVPIYYDDKMLGELRLSGLQDTAAQTRLATEASLLASLVRLEDDLQAMTAELVDSQDRLVAVYQLTRSLRNYLTIQETLQSLLFESLRLLKAEKGFVIFAPSMEDPTIEQFPSQYADISAISAIFFQAQQVEREILRSSPDALKGFPEEVRNLCFVPIRVRGSIIAGIGLLNKSAGFSMPDIKLARAIVEQSSVHIEQVLLHQETAAQRRLQTDLDLARRVQLRLLPQQLPEVSGLDIYARSRPAFQIGGDFYDFISLPRRSMIFSVGDVSGKALSAALLMTMTRTAIHSKASYMPNPTPELVMRNSNEDLFDDFVQVGMFATVFIGQYLPQHRQLIYANAGHSPVIFCRKGGKAEILGADSPPLGVLNKSLCKNHTLDLEPGDVLVVATDGFNEALSPSDEMFGYDRLLDIVTASACQSAASIADTLFKSVERFGYGRPQDDDQTLIVIKGVGM
jgi:sigma-B regulation protein RsbU (phosphoserine phosphatase)